MANEISWDLWRALWTASQASNLTEAAKRLGVSQPALSLQLKKLEIDFGFPLFVQQGTRKVLNTRARELIRTLQPAFEFFEDRLDQSSHQLEGSRIRIGGRREALEQIAKKIPPEISFEFQFGSTLEAIQKLKAGELEMSISRFRPNHSEILEKFLFKSEGYLVWPKEWKISKGSPSALWPSLRDRPALAYDHDRPFLGDFLQSMKAKKSEVKVSSVVPDWNILTDRINRGAGWSVVPSGFIENLNAASYVNLSKELCPEIHFYLLYRREVRRDPQIQKLIQKL